MSHEDLSGANFHRDLFGAVLNLTTIPPLPNLSSWTVLFNVFRHRTSSAEQQNAPDAPDTPAMLAPYHRPK